MEKIPTSEVVKITGCHKSTANNWAKKHFIESVRGPKGKVAIYFWSQEDIIAFKARPKPGRRWDKEN